MPHDKAARDDVRRQPNRRVVCGGCGKRARRSPSWPNRCPACYAAYCRAWYLKNRTRHLAHVRVYDKKRRATEAYRVRWRIYMRAWRARRKALS